MSANVFGANCGPSSDKIIFGSTHIANKSSSAVIVVSDIGYLLNFRTYGHFEYESITNNHVSSRNGPAKSI